MIVREIYRKLKLNCIFGSSGRPRYAEGVARIAAVQITSAHIRDLRNFLAKMRKLILNAH